VWTQAFVPMINPHPHPHPGLGSFIFLLSEKCLPLKDFTQDDNHMTVR